MIDADGRARRHEAALRFCRLLFFATKKGGCIQSGPRTDRDAPNPGQGEGHAKAARLAPACLPGPRFVGVSGGAEHGRASIVCEVWRPSVAFSVHMHACALTALSPSLSVGATSQKPAASTGAENCKLGWKPISQPHTRERDAAAAWRGASNVRSAGGAFGLVALFSTVSQRLQRQLTRLEDAAEHREPLEVTVLIGEPRRARGGVAREIGPGGPRRLHRLPRRWDGGRHLYGLLSCGAALGPRALRSHRGGRSRHATGRHSPGEEPTLGTPWPCAVARASRRVHRLRRHAHGHRRSDENSDRRSEAPAAAAARRGLAAVAAAARCGGGRGSRHLVPREARSAGRPRRERNPRATTRWRSCSSWRASGSARGCIS